MRNDFDIFVIGSYLRVLIQNMINSKLSVERSRVIQKTETARGKENVLKKFT